MKESSSKETSRLVSTLQPFSRDIILYLSNLQKSSLFDILINPTLSEAGPEPPKRLRRSSL